MHDVIIIGAGPAGLTAGLYAGRYRLNTLILEKVSVGGQIALSPDIENFPGFPGGIPTHELIERFKKQVDDLGVRIESDEAVQITPEPGRQGNQAYNIKTHGASYQCRAVIAASGAQPKRLGVDGEDRLIGRGVSYCGTCDGPLFKGKEVVVVGGGDRALEEAIFLSTYASKVTLIHRRGQLRASAILQEKAGANRKIGFLLDTVIDGIAGQGRVESATVRNVKTGSTGDFSCQGVFIFVGIQPNTVFLKGVLELDEYGFIITDEELNSSSKGIFACGDCRRKSLYQVVTACSDGAVAAASCQRYLL